MKKIGIFGGTFDPPHNGHLLMANEVLYQAGLDEIWFMPNQIPPHKQNEDYTDSFHRVEMLKLAIQSNQPDVRKSKAAYRSYSLVSQ